MKETKKPIKKEFSIPETQEDEILFIKVGSEERLATAKDIQDIQLALAQAKVDGNLTIITHHAVNFIVLKKKLLDNIVVAGNLDALKKHN